MVVGRSQSSAEKPNAVSGLDAGFVMSALSSDPNPAAPSNCCTGGETNEIVIVTTGIGKCLGSPMANLVDFDYIQHGGVPPSLPTPFFRPSRWRNTAWGRAIMRYHSSMDTQHPITHPLLRLPQHQSSIATLEIRVKFNVSS